MWTSRRWSAVVTEDSPAAKTDIQPGDRILTVADRNVDTWEQFFIAVAPHANREVSLAIQRDGREIERKVTPIVPAGRSRFETGDIGVAAGRRIRTCGRSRPVSPASAAGCSAGDLMLAVDGVPMRFPEAVSRGDCLASRAADVR